MIDIVEIATVNLSFRLHTKNKGFSCHFFIN